MGCRLGNVVTLEPSTHYAAVDRPGNIRNTRIQATVVYGVLWTRPPTMLARNPHTIQEQGQEPCVPCVRRLVGQGQGYSVEQEILLIARFGGGGGGGILTHLTEAVLFARSTPQVVSTLLIPSELRG